MWWYTAFHLDCSVTVGENYNHGLMGKIDWDRKPTVTENAMCVPIKQLSCIQWAWEFNHLGEWFYVTPDCQDLVAGINVIVLSLAN